MKRYQFTIRTLIEIDKEVNEFGYADVSEADQALFNALDEVGFQDIQIEYNELEEESA